MKAEIKDRIEQIKKDEVPKGYKKTKVGTIPQEWGVEKLEEYTLKMKSGLSRQLESEDIGIPVIRSNNIKNYTIDFSDIKYWYNDDNQGADVKDYYLKDGDILVNFINSIAQIGKMAIFINRIGRNAIYTTNILQIRLKETLNVMFFKFFAETEKYNAYVLSITKPAVNQASFTTVEYKKMSLPIPIKEEQEKIASILSAWDIAIEKQEKLIELKKEQKKWLMQELLTGKKRLKGF